MDKRMIFIALGLALLAPAARALTVYPYGSLPSSANLSSLSSFYSTWASRHLKTGYCSGGLRVDDGSGSYPTVSEGMGYGALMAAYMDSSSANLAKLYTEYMGDIDNQGLMNWQVNSCGNDNQNAATDADVDMAQALIEANVRWPTEGWNTKAAALLNKIYQYEVDGAKGLKPGDVWGGSSAGASGKAYDPSYFCVSYLKDWDCFEGGSRWSAVRTECYTLLNDISGALPPDWIGSAGAYYNNGGTSGSVGGYYYDACRTPWRVTLDYLWFGNAQALALANKWAGNFAPGGAGAGGQTTAAGAAAYIGDGYSYSSGARNSTNHSDCFTGAIGIAAMASGANAAFCNAVYNDLVSTDNNSYFADSLKVIYLMVLTGTFQDAACGSVCTACTATSTPTITLTPTPSSTPTPGFSIAKSAMVATAAAGSTITYYLNYKNLTTSTITGITITDALALRLTFLSSSPAGTVSGTTLSISIASLAAGAQGGATITAQILSAAPAGAIIANSASMAAAGYTTQSSNTVNITVGAAPANTSTSTPTFSATRTITPSPSATETPTQPPAGSTPTATPPASATCTPLPAATATASAGGSGGGGSVLRIIPVPNPDPDHLSTFCQGGVQSMTVAVYTDGYTMVAQWQLGPAHDRWDVLALPAGWSASLPDGTYFVVASAGSSQQGPAAINKLQLRH
jgi:uncharacterized repeat protein (TIGR01451 family)